MSAKCVILLILFKWSDTWILSLSMS